MSSTVSYGSIEASSTIESAASMVEALSPSKDDAGSPRILVDKGQPVEEPDEVSKAASELGKRGGEASAKARKAAKADEATAEDPPEPEEEPEPTEKLGKPRHDPKARMLESTREAAELKREREALRAENARIASELAAARTLRAEPAKEPEAPAKPKAQDYASYEEYLDARDAWSNRQREAAQQRESQVRAQVDGIGRAIEGFQGRLEAQAKTDPSFREATAEIAKTLQPSFTLEPGIRPGPLNVLADEVVSSEHAPALMLYLAEHDEEMQRFAALRSPLEVQVAVARLEGRIERLDAAPTATAPTAQVSKARPPVRTVTGSPQVGSDSEELSDDAPLSAFAKKFAQREARSR